MTSKRSVSPVSLAIWVVLLVVSPLLSQQSGSFNWAYRKIELARSGVVTVVLPPTASEQEYVAGFRVEDVQTPTFVFGEAILSRIGQSSRIVTQIDNVPAELIKSGGSTIELTNLGLPNSSLIVYGTVPKGTRINFRVGTSVIASGLLESNGSLMVRDGAIIPQSVLGVRTLLQTLTAPTATFDDGIPKPLRNGRYFVSTGTLAKNIVSWVRPVAEPKSSCCDSIVKIRVTVSTDGSILTTENLGQGGPESQAIVHAAQQWRFRPFLVNGKAVVAESVVPFFVSRGGIISSPLLQSQ